MNRGMLKQTAINSARALTVVSSENGAKSGENKLNGGQQMVVALKEKPRSLQGLHHQHAGTFGGDTSTQISTVDTSNYKDSDPESKFDGVLSWFMHPELHQDMVAIMRADEIGGRVCRLMALHQLSLIMDELLIEIESMCQQLAELNALKQEGGK